MCVCVCVTQSAVVPLRVNVRARMCVSCVVVLLLFTTEKKKPASCLGDNGDLCERRGSPPPGSANIFRTCRIPPDVRSNRLTLRTAKNGEKKIERNYIVAPPFLYTHINTNEGCARPEDINRCPLSGVSGVRVRTYIVLRVWPRPCEYCIHLSSH